MPVDPTAQPSSAPTPIPAVVVPARRAPAPAGWNCERGWGSIPREHTRVCDSQKPHGFAETGQPCTLAKVHVETLGSGPRAGARPRIGRKHGLAGTEAARR